MKRHIPSIFTSFNLKCGFVALLIGDFYISSWFIFGGMIFDVLDGFSARLLNAQSEIGKELDSMADLITFGVAPAYLYSLLAPGDTWIYFVPALILLLGSALRLAIFNTLDSKNTFTGLATPAAAFFMFGIFLSYNAEIPMIEKLVAHKTGYFIIPMFLTFIILSGLEMYSLKNLQKPFHKNTYHIVTIGLFVLCIFINPPLAPIAAVITYISASYLENLVSIKREKRHTSV